MNEPPRPTAQSFVGRYVWPAVRVVVLSYLGLLVSAYFAQGWIVFPGKTTQGSAAARVIAPAGATLVELATVRGDRIVALFGAALDASGRAASEPRRRPSLIWFYGNGMSLADTLPLFDELRRLGLNVLVPEYVGYGMSGGHASERACYETADAAYDHLAARHDVDPATVLVAGWSLGGAVAIDLASRRHVSGLATLSTFTSIVALAHRLYPFLPTSLLLRHRFPSDEKIARVEAPIFIAHGSRDRVVPFAMSDELAVRARTPPTRLRVEGADHDDVFAVGGERLLGELARWAHAGGDPR